MITIIQQTNVVYLANLFPILEFIMKNDINYQQKWVIYILVYVPYHPSYASPILAQESHLYYLSRNFLINLQCNQKGTKISLKYDSIQFKKCHNTAVNNTKEIPSVIK